MEKIYSSTFLILILFTGFSFGQETTVHTLDFETQNSNNSLYTLTDEVGTPLTEYSDTSSDYFLRTDGSDINGVYNSPQGTHFFAGMDIDAEAANIGSSDIPFDMTISNIDISQSQGLGVRILLAEDDDGSNQDWDGDTTTTVGDFFKIFYIVDGGTKTEAFSVKAAGGTNTEPKVDTDNDGIGDGTAVTDTFAEFAFPIDASGSVMTRVLSFNFGAGDEDIAIDNLRVVDGFSASPSISTSTNSISGFSYIEGSGPSNEKTFTVSGSDLTGDISIDPSNNFEISSTTGDNFTQDPIVLSPTDGSVTSTSIYVRMISGLTAGDINSSILITSNGADQSSINLSGVVYSVPSQDLFISEYAEGSSNNKYVEIYNPLNGVVDLSTYSLKGSNNGSGWIPARDFALSGLLNPGETLIVCNNQSDASILALTSEGFQLPYESPVHYNGDDAIGLFNGPDLIDVIGDPDSDPGSSWSVGTSGSTANRTLVRKITVTQGNIIWSTSAGTTDENSEWVVLAQDTWTFAGSHPHTEAALSIFDFNNQVVKVYPNPVETKLNFSGLTTPVQATVFDMLGKRQLQSEVINTLDVSQLKSGLYMIEIKNENSSKVFNILKK
jgi:hypothetical protein